jgi:hypothetical protein
MKAFWRGVITGAGIILALVLVIAVFRFFHNREKKFMSTWSGKMRYRNCGRITATVILMSFLTIRGYGEPPTAALNEYTGSGTKLYSGAEVQGMIDELEVHPHHQLEPRACGLRQPVEPPVSGGTGRGEMGLLSGPGPRYCAKSFRDRLGELRPPVRQSMSRKGNCPGFRLYRIIF